MSLHCDQLHHQMPSEQKLHHAKCTLLQMLHLLLLASQVILERRGIYFLTSAPVQPPNQVSIYFINFLYMYLTSLIKGHFCLPPSETFNLHNVSDGSQEEGADVTVAPDPGLATPSHHQRRKARQAGKAGSRQGKKLPADLQCGFNEEKDGKRVCKFLL
jgi:hypothetical protein